MLKTGSLFTQHLGCVFFMSASYTRDGTVTKVNRSRLEDRLQRRQGGAFDRSQARIPFCGWLFDGNERCKRRNSGVRTRLEWRLANELGVERAAPAVPAPRVPRRCRRAVPLTPHAPRLVLAPARRGQLHICREIALCSIERGCLLFVAPHCHFALHAGKKKQKRKARKTHAHDRKVLLLSSHSKT